MRVNGCQCDHTERRCVRSMDKGESEESNGRDGEIRTRDLLTPSGNAVSKRRNQRLILTLQTLVATGVL